MQFDETLEFQEPYRPSLRLSDRPNHDRGIAPRLWTLPVVTVVSLIAFIIASALMIAIAFYVVHGEIDRQLIASEDGMMSVSSTRAGLLLLVAFPQLALVIPTLGAALLSPEPAAKRLSLVRGHWPLWAWAAAAAATPLVGWASSVIVGSLMEESDNLRMMSEVFRSHGESGFLIPLALLIGATPAICEEFLFRGYIQTRLTVARGPLLGILCSSALFAVFHMDWVHIVAVFPLGVFLGYVAWRSGSLLPAMVAHCFNNVVSVIAVVLAPKTETDSLSPTMSSFLLFVLGFGLLGALGFVTAACKYPPKMDDKSDGDHGGIENVPPTDAEAPV